MPRRRRATSTAIAPTRIRSQVETRAQTCERWLPLWRALNANQGNSTELKTRIRLVRERDHAARIELMYRAGTGDPVRASSASAP